MSILKVHSIHYSLRPTFITFPSGKTKGTKNAPCFLSRAPNHDSFIFIWRVWYYVKHKVRLSKIVWNFPFSISFRFY